MGYVSLAHAAHGSALEIDVRNKEVRDTLYKALNAQKKDAEADRIKKMLEKTNKDTSG